MKPSHRKSKENLILSSSVWSLDFISKIVDFRGMNKLRLFIGFLSPILLGLSLGFGIAVEYGSFSFGVLIEGLHESFKLQFWIWQTIIAVLFFVLAWIIGRVRLGAGTIPTLLFLGPAIDLGVAIVPEDMTTTSRVLILVIGLSLYGFSVLLSVAADLGPENVSALCLALERRYEWKVATTMFVLSVAAVGIGFILGGTVSIPTALSLVLPAIFLTFGLKTARNILGTQL